MQSAAKHLAWTSNLIVTTVLITCPREMLRCALHDGRELLMGMPYMTAVNTLHDGF